MNKVYLETYGCSANHSDSELMRGFLQNNNFTFVESPDEADINIINTCAVKSPTINRMIFRIQELSKSEKPLVVAGCMTKTEREVIEKINSQASLIGPEAINKISDVAALALTGEKIVRLEKTDFQKAFVPKIRFNPIVDIIQISSGCLSNCSFCATKIARGHLNSYRPHLIREEIKDALRQGIKEIWLTSQDNSAYGRDIKTNLAELLDSTSRIEGDFFIRVGMMNPLHFKHLVEVDHLIASYKNEKVYKFLHLCVQSGSDKVLFDMKRGYTVSDFINFVEKFRKEIPELTLETDIIVGFPTEDEEDFEKTIRLVKKIRFDLVNISKYGARTGTFAAKMKQISKKIVDERSKGLHELVKKISLEKNRKWIGWKGKVLVGEAVKNGFVGRNSSYKPIFIRSTEKNIFGKVIDAEIVNATSNSLIGYKI